MAILDDLAVFQYCSHQNRKFTESSKAAFGRNRLCAETATFRTFGAKNETENEIRLTFIKNGKVEGAILFIAV